MDSSKKSSIHNAFLIGGMCFFAYLAVYIARNVLGAASPQMIESGDFTRESLGSLSSLYFITYAVGQLINGAIGDKIKAKYMISFGLCLAGVCNFLFLFLSGSLLYSYIAYGATGFFLSMIYGPMTKVIAENIEPIYATRCSLGYTVASFLGSPGAGLLAAMLTWRSVLSVSSVTLLGMGVICFTMFLIYEKKGIIHYNQYLPSKEEGGSIKLLFQHKIIKFTLISMVTGVVRTSVIFWLPTYLSEYLDFSTETSALLFTASTLIISLTAFVAIFLYERAFHRNMEHTILFAFSSASICFMLVYLLMQPVLNIIFMVLAIMSSGCASSMLWSRYCPGLRDTGMVSRVTGYLDFVSYIAASISSTVFANAVSVIGWHGLILIWFGLMIFGVIIALPYDYILKKNTSGEQT